MPKRGRSIGPIARKNELLQKPRAYLNHSYRINNQTEIPTVAKAWCEKLLQLHSQQKDLAENAITDVLFETRQGTLHSISVNINEGFHTIVQRCLTEHPGQCGNPCLWAIAPTARIQFRPI